MIAKENSRIIYNELREQLDVEAKDRTSLWSLDEMDNLKELIQAPWSWNLQDSYSYELRRKEQSSNKMENDSEGASTLDTKKPVNCSAQLIMMNYRRLIQLSNLEDPVAMDHLASAVLSPNSIIGENISLAKTLYLEAARRGDIQAHMNLGWLYVRLHDNDQARRVFQSSFHRYDAFTTYIAFINYLRMTMLLFLPLKCNCHEMIVNAT